MRTTQVFIQFQLLTIHSAGGGGNSEARREKIQAKNSKLHDERANDRVKRVELDMKQADRAAKKGNKGADGEEEGAAEPDNNGIHPARLAMLAATSGPARPSYPSHRQRY